MKRPTILLGLVTLLIFAVILNHRHQRAQAEAINAVFTNRLAAFPQSYVIVMVGRQERKKFSQKEFLSHLKAIKTDGCPEEFRFTWLDYIQTWDRWIQPSLVQRREDMQVRRAVSGSAHLSGGIGLGHTGGEIAVEFDNKLSAMEMAKRLEDRNCQEAWHKCEKVALKFGVQGY